MVYPRKNLLFLRKTDSDVLEVLRQVKLLLATDAMQELTGRIYGSPVQVLRGDMWSVNTDCYAAIRGAPQLLGLGTGGIDDRRARRHHPHRRHCEPAGQNQRRGAQAHLRRVSGTAEHPQSGRANPEHRHAVAPGRRVPPNAAAGKVRSCYQTGLLTKDAIAKLRAAMSPTLFAANYELRHIATGGGLFEAHPPETEDPLLLRDGIAHLDASYGGEDFAALNVRVHPRRSGVPVRADLAEAGRFCTG